MGVKFITRIREKLELTVYGLAKLIGVPSSIIDNYEKRGKYIDPIILCKLRKASGESWNEFGKDLDNEFLNKKTLD